MTMTMKKRIGLVLLAGFIVGGFVLTEKLSSQTSSEQTSTISQVPATSPSSSSSSGATPTTEGDRLVNADDRYLRSLDGSQRYELDLNPSGTLSDDELSKAMHEKTVVLRQLDPTTGSYQVVGPIDLGGIGRVTAMFEDSTHGRIFLQEYVSRLYYKLWVIDAKHLRVATALDIRSPEPEMPLVVSPDGHLLFISWQPDNAVPGGPVWQTAAIDTRNYKTIQRSSDFTVHLSRFGGLESSEFSEDGKQLFTYKLSANSALNDSADTLLVIDASTSRITETIPYSDMAPGRLTVRGVRNGKVIATEELEQGGSSNPSVFGVVYDLGSQKLLRRVVLDGYAAGWSLVDRTGSKLVIDVWKETPDEELVPAGSLHIFDLQNGRSSKISIVGRVLLSSPQDEIVYVGSDHQLAKVDIQAAAVTEQLPLTRQAGRKGLN
jgi:endonuclease V-like protein UPF0215 family